MFPYTWILPAYDMLNGFLRFLTVPCPIAKWGGMPGEAFENRLEWVEDCPASTKKVVGIPYKL
ncbi:hypothetical protein EZS27_025737 [termite gut metagenome]|uniref:Uncharacterized protein n=1 Tax=termite gut metagenome TaxID=433724 RepID=A0A5J4QUT3_9ZZZZ